MKKLPNNRDDDLRITEENLKNRAMAFAEAVRVLQFEATNPRRAKDNAKRMANAWRALDAAADIRVLAKGGRIRGAKQLKLGLEG